MGGNLASVFSSRDMRRLYNPTLESYNPTLENVIYTEVKDGKAGVVLYNIKEKQKVLDISTANAITLRSFGAAPVWSPDGNRALMLLPTSMNNYTEQSLLLLDKSGKVDKLTSFEILGPYSWSPDGKYIAFWLPEGNQIGILNVENKDIRVFCINGDYTQSEHYPAGLGASGDLVWLPNDNQILVEVVKHVGDVRYEGIGVADLDKAIFNELKWNASYPVWLEK